MPDIFAISDLHLSRTGPGDAPLSKPMELFGPAWSGHQQRLEDNWRALVSPEDTVLLPGDLSWAMTLDEARWDMEFLGRLPGRKLLIKGNHDYWWQSFSKVREHLPVGTEALQHTAAEVNGWAVTGTRGWLSPGHADFHEGEDRKIYQRELMRLEMGLTAAAKLKRPLIVMLHYPPLLSPEEPGEFSALLERWQVRYCLYGHVHGDKAAAFTGALNGVEYLNCSCDRLAMTPLRITGPA